MNDPLQKIGRERFVKKHGKEPNYDELVEESAQHNLIAELFEEIQKLRDVLNLD